MKWIKRERKQYQWRKQLFKREKKRKEAEEKVRFCIIPFTNKRIHPSSQSIVLSLHLKCVQRSLICMYTHFTEKKYILLLAEHLFFDWSRVVLLFSFYVLFTEKLIPPPIIIIGSRTMRKAVVVDISFKKESFETFLLFIFGGIAFSFCMYGYYILLPRIM